MKRRTSPLPRTIELMNELERRLADEHGPITDYRLSQVMGFTRKAVSAWRTGRSTLGDDAIVKFAELGGWPVEYVAACIQAERTQNDRLRRAWEAVGKAALGAVLIGILQLPLPLEPVKADPSVIYIMRRRRQARRLRLRPPPGRCWTGWAASAA